MATSTTTKTWVGESRQGVDVRRRDGSIELGARDHRWIALARQERILTATAPIDDEDDQATVPVQIGDRIDIVGRKPRGISVELMVRFGFEWREAPMLARFLAAMLALAVATARALGQSAPPYTNERTPIMTRLARP
jgi:hypothetical protein